MESSYWTLGDFLVVIYSIIWLVYLTNKHYGKVTTTAGHIFELNVLLNYTIFSLSVILIFTFDFRQWMPDILLTSVMYSWWLAIVGSQIETAIFLKTLNVNTMMTNTAGKIILGMTIFSVVMGVLSTALLPSMNVNLGKKMDCALFINKEAYFYRMIVPSTVGVVIVLAVLSFALFRSFEIRQRSGNDMEAGHGGIMGDVLFTISPVVSEELRKAPPVPMEHDIKVEDIELVDNQQDDIEAENIELVNIQQDDKVVERIETPPSLEQLSIRAMIRECGQNNELKIQDNRNQQHSLQWLPGIGILQTLNKYLKNSLISLLILTIELPWHFTTLYGIITASGCENPTLILMYKISYVYYFSFYIFLPLCIMIKLDRLSE